MSHEDDVLWYFVGRRRRESLLSRANPCHASVISSRNLRQPFPHDHNHSTRSSGVDNWQRARKQQQCKSQATSPINLDVAVAVAVAVASHKVTRMDPKEIQAFDQKAGSQVNIGF